VHALPTEAKPPVVLLHGFIDNRSVFVLLRRSLTQHGRQQIESLNYSPLACDIRTAAELLGRHIEVICERTTCSDHIARCTDSHTRVKGRLYLVPVTPVSSTRSLNANDACLS